MPIPVENMDFQVIFIANRILAFRRLWVIVIMAVMVKSIPVKMDNPGGYVTQPTTVRYQQASPTRLGRLLLGGEHVAVPGHELGPMPMRRWNIYSLVYVVTGSGRYADQSGRHQRLTAGDLLLLFPRHGYAYQVDRHCRWGEIYVQFDGPVFDLWRRRQVLDPRRPILHLEPAEHWAERLRHLLRPPEGAQPYQALRRVCELQAFLVEALAAAAGLSPGSLDDPWVSRARERLDELALDPTPDWPDLAADLGLSAERFRKKFAQLTGETPFAYLAGRRIARACELLRNPEVGVKAVAARCGFPDEFHFSRRFKQLVGVGPRDYRRLLHRRRERRRPGPVALSRAGTSGTG